MKTWMNPEVEELEVKQTAAWIWATSLESQNGELELDKGQIDIDGDGTPDEEGEIIVGQKS